MARKPSRSPEPDSRLAALLEPHLDTLGEAAKARAALAQAEAERQAAVRRASSRRRLDEAELMVLIFDHLDPDNPRVCEGIEFDRLVVLTDAAEPSPSNSNSKPNSASNSPGSKSTSKPELAAHRPAPKHPSSEAPQVDARAWVGQSWADDIRPIPAELLDRPELDPEQRALLTRAGRLELASLNLRRLVRAQALAHLELFVRACRAERVRFCRVIPGKGIDSRAEPVIKRAVIEWSLAGDAVLGWAPELDRHGEWGAMILELRAPTR